MSHLKQFKDKLASIQSSIVEEQQPLLYSLLDLTVLITRNHKPSEVINPRAFKEQLALRN